MFISSHTHTHGVADTHCLWLMRPGGWRWFHQGSPSHLLLPSTHPPSHANTLPTHPAKKRRKKNPHLIDSGDLSEKREMGNWKMEEEDWKQRADYKLWEKKVGKKTQKLRKRVFFFLFFFQRRRRKRQQVCRWQVPEWGPQKTLQLQTNGCV